MTEPIYTPVQPLDGRKRAVLLHPVSMPRSPEWLNTIIDSHHVEEEPRYQPRAGLTFCNIFLWDVTTALGVEVPHWVDKDGNPADPFSKGARETLAGELLQTWFPTVGRKRGWLPVGADPAKARPSAQALADKGFPVVAGWINPRGHSHVAVVRPNRFGSQASVPRIAQAGGRCFNDGPLKDGFGSRPVEFWFHD